MKISIRTAVVVTIAIVLFPFWSKLGWSLIPIFLIGAVWMIALKSRSDKLDSVRNHPAVANVISKDSDMPKESWHQS